MPFAESESDSPHWNIIDLVREIFEDEPGPVLIQRVDDMDAARLDRFMAQYALRRDEQQVYLRLPTKGANELRPYLGWRWGAPTGQQILGQGFDDWGERGAAFRYIDALKQPLLYSHSLAVRNPLGSEAYAWRSVAELGMGGFPWTRRRRRCLAEYLTFIREMRPLLESDVLILVEEPAYIAGDNAEMVTNFSIAGGAPRELFNQQLYEEIASRADFADAAVLLGTPTGDSFTQRIDLVARAVWDIWADIRLSNSTGGRTDLYLPFSYYQETLFGMWQAGLKAMAAGRLRDRDAAIIRNIMRAAVPDLAQLGSLSPADIVALRRNSPTFEYWRTRMQALLNELRQVDQEEFIDKESSRISAVQSAFADIARETMELAGADPIVRRTASIMDFTIGAVADTAIEALFAPLNPGAAMKAVVKKTLETIRGYSKLEEQRALFHHYLVFRPDLVNPQAIADSYPTRQPRRAGTAGHRLPLTSVEIRDHYACVGLRDGALAGSSIDDPAAMVAPLLLSAVVLREGPSATPGRTVRLFEAWDVSGAGATGVAVLDGQGAVVGVPSLCPTYRASAVRPCKVLAWDIDSPSMGAVVVELEDEHADSETGHDDGIPIVVDIDDLALLSAVSTGAGKFPAVGEATAVSIAAFVDNLDVIEPEPLTAPENGDHDSLQHSLAQPPLTQPGSVLLQPPGSPEKEYPRAATVRGTILASDRPINTLSGLPFGWALVQTPAGPIDVVFPVGPSDDPPEPGNIIDANCWVVGRIIQAPEDAE